jgi:hypothetical protein
MEVDNLNAQEEISTEHTRKVSVGKRYAMCDCM